MTDYSEVVPQYFIAEDLQSLMPNHATQEVKDKVTNAVNMFVGDVDAEEREAYKEALMGYSYVMKTGKYTTTDYLRAIRYVTIRQTGATQMEAYSRVFPERIERMKEQGRSNKYMSGIASQYNQTKLVSTIVEQSLIPVHLMNLDLYQEAINVQANLMRTAKSEMVRHKAADSLMDKLRAPEKVQMEINVGANTRSDLEAIRIETEKLAELQRKQLSIGGLTMRDMVEKTTIGVIVEGETVEQGRE